MKSEKRNEKRGYDGTGISPLLEGGTLHSSQKREQRYRRTNLYQYLSPKTRDSIPDLGKSAYTLEPAFMATKRKEKTKQTKNTHTRTNERAERRCL